jgi:hypothetical protein
MGNSILYYGSKTKIDSIIEPMKDMAINNESAVIALNARWLAIAAIPRLSDISIGYDRDGIPFIKERAYGAFWKLHISGYIYQISNKGFVRDTRLLDFMSICRNSVPIVSEEYIEDVYEGLKKENGLKFIYYSASMQSPSTIAS